MFLKPHYYCSPSFSCTYVKTLNTHLILNELKKKHLKIINQSTHSFVSLLILLLLLFFPLEKEKIRLNQ